MSLREFVKTITPEDLQQAWEDGCEWERTGVVPDTFRALGDRAATFLDAEPGPSTLFLYQIMTETWRELAMRRAVLIDNYVHAERDYDAKTSKDNFRRLVGAMTDLRQDTKTRG